MSGIFFDARYIRIDHHDGISRFSAGLFGQLHKLIDVTAIISDLRQLEFLPADTKFVKLSDPTSPLEPLIAFKLNALGAKTVFSPMQTMGTFGKKFKLVLTLHDLIYYRHPTPPPVFNAFIRGLWRLFHATYIPQRWLLNRADAVATVSETTKSLMKQHRLTRKPIHVIYNAAEAGDSHPTNRTRPNNKQLVYMGSFMQYKNVEALIAVMNYLPDFKLLLLSRISDNRRAELLAISPEAVDRIVFKNGVSESEYHELLCESYALVSASLDEGFGIPVVEAFSRATPAIISNIEIFKEIGASAAVYFDPSEVTDIARAIQLIDSDTEWLKHSKSALARSLDFGWDKSANQLAKLLLELNG